MLKSLKNVQNPSFRRSTASSGIRKNNENWWKCYNSWISLLFTKSGTTRIEILLSRQERLLFKTSEQRFWATPGHKGYFEITRERKTEVQEYVLQDKIKDVCLKSCKNGRT